MNSKGPYGEDKASVGYPMRPVSKRTQNKNYTGLIFTLGFSVSIGSSNGDYIQELLS